MLMLKLITYVSPYDLGWYERLQMHWVEPRPVSSLYSSLFTKYGRQLNRKIQQKRRYEGTYILNAKTEINVRQQNINK